MYLPTVVCIALIFFIIMIVLEDFKRKIIRHGKAIDNHSSLFLIQAQFDEDTTKFCNDSAVSLDILYQRIENLENKNDETKTEENHG